jgi:hypothetical protein
MHRRMSSRRKPNQPKRKKKRAIHETIVEEEKCVNTSTNVGPTDAPDICTTLYDGSIEAMVDELGSHVTTDSYTVHLPSGLTPIMFDYIQDVGLLRLFTAYITTPSRSFSNTIVQCRHQWNVRCSPLPKNSIMYWISPSDEATTSNMLYYLTAGGLRQVLQQLSSVIGEHLNHLTLFQMTFIIVHRCEELLFDTDFHPALSGQAYTLLFPLKLVQTSPPEVVLQQDCTGKLHSFHYEKGCAFLWGPNTMHATAMMNYCDDEFRICISLSLAHITPMNVQLILRDISQQYPPKREKFLLELAANAHWTRNSGRAECNLPVIDESIIYGKELHNYLCQFIELERSGTALLSYPTELQDWITRQQHAYGLKHGMSSNRSMTFSNVKAVKTLTDSREQKLKDNNFSFSLSRDKGRNQERWEHMFQRAQKHKEEHRSLRVSKYVYQQLSSWIVLQRKKLRDDSKLSTMGIVRKGKLVQLGLTF